MRTSFKEKDKSDNVRIRDSLITGAVTYFDKFISRNNQASLFQNKLRWLQPSVARISPKLINFLQL